MKKIFLPLLSVAIIFFCYRSWFLSKDIIGGDWPVYFSEYIREFSFFPHAWSGYQGNGLGGPELLFALDSYLYMIGTVFVNLLHVPWQIVYKIFYFGFFLAGSIYSIRRFIRYLIPDASEFLIFAGTIIYTTNTYILMVTGGGQMGVALAYALFPFVLIRWIKSVDFVRETEQKFLNRRFWIDVIVLGFLFSTLILFDIRFAYMAAMAIGIYLLISAKFSIPNRDKDSVMKNLASGGVLWIAPMIVAGFIHAFWLFPIILLRTTPVSGIQNSYISSGAFVFFSFASFSSSLSLLHPNWPENIFGKIYFFKPEFLVIPVLGFIGLLSQASKKIFFVALLTLVGAFLSKGANDPFGGINIWFYDHIPGYVLFRDSTKFYVFGALGYSLLVPLGLSTIEKILHKTRARIYSVGKVVIVIFLVFWSLTIRQFIMEDLSGTFKSRVIPTDYVNLKNFLAGQQSFSRTLWVPHQERYNFYSSNHPAIDAMAFFHATSSSQLKVRLADPITIPHLSRMGVAYIIVPSDPEKEIYLKDRKFDDSQRLDFISSLDSIKNLTKLTGFGTNAVYELQSHKDHIYLAGAEKTGENRVSYKRINATQYQVNVNLDHDDTIVFAEQYNPSWQAAIDGEIIQSIKTQDGFNSFKLTKGGRYSVDINFSQESIYNYGKLISIASILGLLTVYLVLSKEKKA